MRFHENSGLSFSCAKNYGNSRHLFLYGQMSIRMARIVFMVADKGEFVLKVGIERASDLTFINWKQS